MRLIDADELIKDIDYSADMGGALGKVVECVKYYAKYMVASAPTIERKTGKWIPFNIPWYQCSECGAVRKHVAFMENYCPNCGARMQEGEDEWH